MNENQVLRKFWSHPILSLRMDKGISATFLLEQDDDEGCSSNIKAKF